MRRLTLAVWIGVVASFGSACGSSGGSTFNAGAGARDGGGGDATLGDGGTHFTGDGGGMGGDSSSCAAPDILIVLDHTDSMSDTPAGTKPPNTDAGQAQTKWVLACDAMKLATAAPADQARRFGLELFPLDPATVDAGGDAGSGNGSCVTLSQLLTGMAASNKSCQPAEVLVPPALGTGATIATILDPQTRKLCVSTPIALALETAGTELLSIATPGKDQFVLLVTDGGETCGGDAVMAAQALAAKGIKTFVVGFGTTDGGASGVNVKLLNEVACAGMTAKGFPAPCTNEAGGYTATDPKGAPIFYTAEDGPSISQALSAITSHVCCGCVQ